MEFSDVKVGDKIINRENPEDHTNIFDFAKENNMSVSDVKYIKFGK